MNKVLFDQRLDEIIEAWAFFENDLPDDIHLPPIIEKVREMIWEYSCGNGDMTESRNDIWNLIKNYNEEDEY